MSVSLDINTLNWVKSEIDETLKQARLALETYVEIPDDVSQLRFCLNYIHQVYGTLQMVELYGASMLAEEMEHLTKALLGDKVGNRDDAYEVLMRGIVQLPDYLEHIQAGHDDVPVVLLPLLNDMRAARNEALLSENALFTPDMSAVAPKAEVPVTATDIQVLAKKLRHQFHLGLLDWFRDRDVAGGLKRISNVLQQLRNNAGDSELARLLWTAQGILEGLQSEHLETGVAVKLLMGQVDRQIKRVIDQGESAFHTLPPDDLVKNLLYYVAQSDSGTPLVDEIKQAFKLEQALPDAERLDQARAELRAPNAELMQTVASVLLDDLTQVKDNLDVFVRAEERNLDALSDMSLKLNQMADTLGMLGFGTQRKTIQEQVTVMQSMVAGQRGVDDASLMNIAGAILTIEQSLKEPGGQGARPSGDDRHEDRMRDPEFRQLMTSVLTEACNELNKVKHSVNNFSLSPRNVSLLEDVPGMLDRIRGSLSMLNLERAELLIDSVENYVRHKVLTGEKMPNEAELDALADTISSIEYYMESLVDSWGHPTAILDVAEERLHLLGAFDEEEHSEEAVAPLADTTVTNDDATLIDLPEISEADEMLLIDDEDDTEVDIVAPLLDDEDSLVLDGKGLELGDGLTLEGLDSEPDFTLDDGFEAGNELTSESGGLELEIDFGDALPEAITNDTNEISIAEAFGVERIGEALELWLNDPYDSSTAELLQEVCLHAQHRAETSDLNQAVEIIKDMSALIDKIQKQEISLDEGVKNTLYMTRDALLNLFAEAGIQADDTHIHHDIEDTATVPEVEFEEASIAEVAAPPPAEIINTSTSPLADDLDDEIIEIFLEEAEEESANITSFLPIWRANPADEESLREMRRSFHTLKGSGRLVGATDVGEFAWAFENMLNRVLDKTVTPGSEMFAILEKATESLPMMFELFKSGHKPPPQSIYTLMEFAEALSHDKPIDLQQLDSNMPDISLTQKMPEGLNAIIEIPHIDPALLDIYRKEINSHLSSLDRYLTAWDEDGLTEVSHDLIRALHTLNGSSRTTGVSNLVELFSTLEKYTKYLQTNHLPVPRALIDLIQESMSYTRAVADSLENAGDEMPDDDALLVRIHRAFDDLRFETPTLEMMTPAEVKTELDDAAKSTQATPVPAVAMKENIADYDEELVEIFLEEGTEILDESDQTIHEWMQDIENHSYIEALQRQLHTLKGGSRMAGILAIGDLSHSIESMLTAVVEDRLSPSDEMFNVMQQAHDRLATMLEQVRYQQSIPAATDLINAVEAIVSGRPRTSGPEAEIAGFEVVGAETELEPEIITETPRNDEQQEEVSPPNVISAEESMQVVATEMTDNVIQMGTAKPILVEAETYPVENVPDRTGEMEVAPSKAVEARGREQVRVRADLLDNLVNFAGEVSIYRSRLEQQSNAFRYNLQELNDTISRLRGQLRQFEMEAEAQIQYRLEETSGRAQEDFDPLEFDRFTQMQTLSRGMLESLNDLDSLRGILTNLTRESETLLVQQARVNTELQEGLMRTRMVPFIGQVPRLRRIVRQTAQELYKKVELHIVGADNELDRNVLERILSPLEHMLRNAIAHGIEKPKQRVALGKPEQGNIFLTVTKEGSDIVIRVRDDGTGIDLEAIREKAVSRGMLKADARTSGQALLDFILESGFSTATEVTQIAGRGVGLDVVNNEIKQLGGTLNIDTTKGQGASFAINLPLTLSITRALMVNVGDDLFAIPLLGVEGVERVSNDVLKQLHAEDNPVYHWLNEDSQFMHLGSVLGICEPRLGDEHKHTSLLMVRSGELHAAIQVEGLIGSREIVVKPVGPQLSTLRGISGATIMGDGRVVLILDLGVLIRLANAQRNEIDVLNKAAEEVVVKRKPVIMVVDDSITVRKVTTRLLERNDMEAISAKDGVDALAQLQDVRPDILLLDVEMPRMDGFELATNMRNDESLKDIPIIMITSRTGEKHRERALGIGVNDYMGKPYNEIELLESIHNLITK